MIRLMQINGAPVFGTLDKQMNGSEIRLAELTADVRRRLNWLAVRENFDQVLLINPDLDHSLNAFVSDLAGASLKVYVISNQGLTHQPSNHAEKKQEAATMMLQDLLPRRSLCRTPDVPLSSLLEELKNKNDLTAGKSMLITNFSLASVAAGLEFLGFPELLTSSESKQRFVSGAFKDYDAPISSLHTLISNLKKDERLKNIGADRTDKFLEILEEMFES